MCRNYCMYLHMKISRPCWENLDGLFITYYEWGHNHTEKHESSSRVKCRKQDGIISKHLIFSSVGNFVFGKTENKNLTFSWTWCKIAVCDFKAWSSFVVTESVQKTWQLKKVFAVSDAIYMLLILSVPVSHISFVFNSLSQHMQIFLWNLCVICI